MSCLRKDVSQRFVPGGVAILCPLLLVCLMVGCKPDSTGDGGPSLNERYRSALKIGNDEERAVELAEIGQQQFKAKDSPAAKKSFAAAQKAAAAVADPLQQASVYVSLTKSMAGAGDAKAQKENVKNLAAAIEKIDDMESKAEMQAKLGLWQYKVLDTDIGMATLKSTEEIVAELPDARGKVYVLGAIAKSYGDIKSPEEAERVLQLAVSIAKEVESPSERVQTLLEVARAQHTAKQKKAALATLADSVEIANSIKDNPTQAGLRLLDVAEFYIEIGEKGLAGKQTDKAQELATGPGADPSTALEITERIQAMEL